MSSPVRRSLVDRRYFLTVQGEKALHIENQQQDSYMELPEWVPDSPWEDRQRQMGEGEDCPPSPASFQTSPPVSSPLTVAMSSASGANSDTEGSVSEGNVSESEEEEEEEDPPAPDVGTFSSPYDHYHSTTSTVQRPSSAGNILYSAAVNAKEEESGDPTTAIPTANVPQRGHSASLARSSQVERPLSAVLPSSTAVRGLSLKRDDPFRLTSNDSVSFFRARQGDEDDDTMSLTSPQGTHHGSHGAMSMSRRSQSQQSMQSTLGLVGRQIKNPSLSRPLSAAPPSESESWESLGGGLKARPPSSIASRQSLIYRGGTAFASATMAATGVQGSHEQGHRRRRRAREREGGGGGARSSQSPQPAQSSEGALLRFRTRVPHVPSADFTQFISKKRQHNPLLQAKKAVRSPPAASLPPRTQPNSPPPSATVRQYIEAKSLANGLPIRATQPPKPLLNTRFNRKLDELMDEIRQERRRKEQEVKPLVKKAATSPPRQSPTPLVKTSLQQHLPQGIRKYQEYRLHEGSSDLSLRAAPLLENYHDLRRTIALERTHYE
jgi:hypothetical protein